MELCIGGATHYNLPDAWSKAQIDDYTNANPIRRLVLAGHGPASPTSRLNAHDRHHLGVQLGREITTKTDLQRGLDETGLGFRDNMDFNKQPTKEERHEATYSAAVEAADKQLSQ